MDSEAVLSDELHTLKTHFRIMTFFSQIGWTAFSILEQTTFWAVVIYKINSEYIQMNERVKLRLLYNNRVHIIAI